MTAEYCNECGARRGTVHRLGCSMPGQWVKNKMGDLSHLMPTLGFGGMSFTRRQLNCPGRMGLSCIAQFLELSEGRREVSRTMACLSADITELLETLHGMTGASFVMTMVADPAAAVKYLRELSVKDDDLQMIIEAAEVMAVEGSEALIEALTEYRESR